MLGDEVDHVGLRDFLVDAVGGDEHFSATHDGHARESDVGVVSKGHVLQRALLPVSVLCEVQNRGSRGGEGHLRAAASPMRVMRTRRAVDLLRVRLLLSFYNISLLVKITVCGLCKLIDLI